MTPKILIETAINNAFDKCYPHIFTDDPFIQECREMNDIFLHSFRIKILDIKKLKEIQPGLVVEPNTTHYYFNDYLNDLVKPSTYIIQDYFNSQKIKASSLQNKEHFNVLNIMSEKVQNFYDNIISEINKVNQVNYQIPIEEQKFYENKTSNTERLKYSITELGIEFDEFSNVTQQKSFIVCGNHKIEGVKFWLKEFNKESKKVMHMIGLPSEAIHLNNTINFIYDSELDTMNQNGYIVHESGKKRSNHIIACKYSNAEKFPQTILHEWFHALDLNVGYKLFNTLETYASNMALKDVIANNLLKDINPDSLNTFNKIKETISYTYGLQNSESYFSENQNNIDLFNISIQDIIISSFCSKETWAIKDEKLKSDFILSPEYNLLVRTLLSNQLVNDSKSTKRVFSKLLKSSNAKALDLSVKKHTMSNCCEWLHLQTTKELKKFNLNPFFEDSNIKIKNDSAFLVLTKSNYTKAAYMQARYKQKDYLNLTHEIMARATQSLIISSRQYELSQRNQFNTVRDYTLSHRDILNSVAHKPDFTYQERINLIETIHSMSSCLGIHSLVTPEQTQSAKLTNTHHSNNSVRLHTLNDNIYIIKKEKALDRKIENEWLKMQTTIPILKKLKPRI